VSLPIRIHAVIFQKKKGSFIRLNHNVIGSLTSSADIPFFHCSCGTGPEPVELDVLACGCISHLESHTLFGLGSQSSGTCGGSNLNTDEIYIMRTIS